MVNLCRVEYVLVAPPVHLFIRFILEKNLPHNAHFVILAKTAEIFCHL